MKGIPTTKPKKRIKRPDEWRREVIERDKRCQFCGRRATVAHHVLRKGQGGDDVLENGMGMDECHDAHHAGNLRITIEDLRPETIEYLKQKGELWRFEKAKAKTQKR